MNPKLKSQLSSLKQASFTLQLSTKEQRNTALRKIKKTLLENIPKILKANQKDLAKINENDPLYDRLLLNDSRIKNICSEIETVISLPDPLERVLEEYNAPSGIHLRKVSVPLGCIGVIYEARPNVSIDVASLCLKSGNAVLLRGSSNAYESNKTLVNLIHQSLKASEISKDSVQLLAPERKLADEMMQANEYLDLIIPRGGQNLIKRVRENSTVPIIETGASVIHTFVDESADFTMALNIIHNEKTRRPGVCNAADTVLVHENIAGNFLPKLAKKMKASQTVLHCDRESFKILKPEYPVTLLKNDAANHYSTEFLSLQMNIHIVKNIDEAISHIRKYSLKHSESIVTKDKSNEEKFQREVDAACVYVNTSTAFSDGAQYGLGAEIGISTQKLHARGPMGLRELCSYKWLVNSEGLIRLK